MKSKLREIFVHLYERFSMEDDLKFNLAVSKTELKTIFDIIDSNLDGVIDEYEVN